MNDKKYWENFYTNQELVRKPSLFAKYCVKNFLHSGYKILELGCGNGRDSIYMAKNGMYVLGLDQCKSEIEFLNNNFSNKNLSFAVKDFSKLDGLSKYDAIYSRFTLHVISLSQEDNLLSSIAKHLNKKGYFLIEARGTNNEYFSKGIKVANEKNAFIYQGHYRRFLDMKEFCDRLKANNLKIISAAEDYNFAPFKNTNQKFIRIIAVKKDGKQI